MVYLPKAFKVVPAASSINGWIMVEFKENRHLQAPKTNFGDLPQPKGTCKWPVQPTHAQKSSDPPTLQQLAQNEEPGQ